MTDFERKRNRLPPPRYRGLSSFFVTLCCDRRRKLFQNEILAEEVLSVLKETCSAHSFQIYAYCFMPDHLHILPQGMQDSANLPEAVRAFKGESSVIARRAGLTRIWQKGFYDHVVRRAESMDKIAWYILMNPVRAELTLRARDWKLSGCVIPNWNRVQEPTELIEPRWRKAEAG